MLVVGVMQTATGKQVRFGVSDQLVPVGAAAHAGVDIDTAKSKCTATTIPCCTLSDWDAILVLHPDAAPTPAQECWYGKRVSEMVYEIAEEELYRIERKCNCQALVIGKVDFGQEGGEMCIRLGSSNCKSKSRSGSNSTSTSTSTSSTASEIDIDIQNYRPTSLAPIKWLLSYDNAEEACSKQQAAAQGTGK
jgi:hypothetical protein